MCPKSYAHDGYGAGHNYKYGDGTHNTGIGDGYGFGSPNITAWTFGDGQPTGCRAYGSPEWEDDEDFSE